MSRNARITICIATGLAAVALAGCGNATHTTTVTQPASAAPTTKAMLISDANRICGRVNDRTRPLIAQINGNRSLAAVAPIAQQIVDIDQSALDRLRALSAPSGDQPMVTKVWDALGNLVADQQNIAKAANDGNLLNVASAGQAAKVAQAMYRGLAQGYGFTACGGGH